MSKIPTYPNKIFCYDCKRMQEHRPKLDAVKNGNLVCNVCDTENPINRPDNSPDQWVVVKITDRGGPGMNDPEYKVYATWAGGYTDGDRWRLNSGITKVEEDDNYFYFYGYSGSCYKCHKKGYGFMTSYGSNTLDNMIKRAGKGGVAVEVMDEKTNWFGLKQNYK
jgi:hypothetical protein